MPVKSFGQFLLERGLITQEMLVKAVEYQRQSVRPVCETAVRSKRAVRADLLRLKKDGGGTDREEEALRQKIRAMEELEASWRTLSERGVFLVEALSKQGALPREQLDALWKEYRRTATAPEVSLESVLPHAPETRQVLECLIEIALDLYGHYARDVPEVCSINRLWHREATPAFACAQEIAGDLCLTYVLSLPEPVLLALASRMLQQPFAAVCPEVTDAALEFLNIVVGNTCTKFSMRNYSVQAGPPRVLTAEELTSLPGRKPIVVTARVSEGTLRLAYAGV